MTNKNNCVGSYSVSGYTRTDGTQVTGYTRTCGAAHNSDYSNTEYENIGLGSKIYADEEFPQYKRIEEESFPRYKKLSREDILYPTMKDKNEIDTKVDNSIFSNSTKERAVNFIAKHEGYEQNAYKPVENDVWTIGYGHTKGVKAGDKITEEQAKKYLIEDFKEHSAPLKEVKINLTENQKIALSSFIFNEGPRAFKTSTLLKKLNEGDIDGAANEFDRWIYKDKKVLKGLVNRRKDEKELFLTPD